MSSKQHIDEPSSCSNASSHVRESAGCCFESIAGCCSRSWTCIRTTAVSAWRWLYNNLLTPPCYTINREPDTRTRSRSKDGTKKPAVRQLEQHSDLSSPPSKIFKAYRSVDSLQQQQQQQPKETLHSVPSTTTPQTASNTTTTMTTTKQTSVIQSTGSGGGPDQQVAQTVKQSSVVVGASGGSNQQRLLQAANQELQQQRLAPSPEIVKPPKIDFIETGSIFGDRKRHGRPNMLLLDNGRFRSPGQPNVIQTPAGRSIRISFQTGFPSIKSIESRAPIAPLTSNTGSNQSKRSDDTTQEQSQQLQQNNNSTAADGLSQESVDIPRRGGGKKSAKKSKRRRRALKTQKSVVSRESKDRQSELSSVSSTDEDNNNDTGKLDNNLSIGDNNN